MNLRYGKIKLMRKSIVLLILIFVVAVVILANRTQSQAGVDDFRFIGEKIGDCPSLGLGYVETHNSEHIGKNLIRTCVKNNDVTTTNDDRVIAVGEKEYSNLGNACPAGYSLKYSSEHIGLNLVRTCGKVDPAPAIVLGEKDLMIGCPVGYTNNGTSEHIGLNNLITCKKIALLSVSLSANPNAGPAPLNNVDLTASVSNAGVGSITYQFDCTNDSSFELTIATPTNPYTATDLCDYPTLGQYTAKVVATQGGESPQGTTEIIVSKAPKIKEILP